MRGRVTGPRAPSKETLIDELLLSRVKKLLNLTASRGATEHEAATALSRAKYLLAKHNLALEDVRRSSRIAAPSVVHASTPLDPYAPAYQRLLADSVARHHFCTLLEDGSFLRFIGRPDAVAVAVELYTWAKTQLDLTALASERRARHDGTWTRGWRSAFLVGAASRIEQRLNAQQLPTETTALMKQVDLENRRYMKREFGRIRYCLPRAPYMDTAHGAGWEAGQSVDLERRRPTLPGQRALAAGRY